MLRQCHRLRVSPDGWCVACVHSTAQPNPSQPNPTQGSPSQHVVVCVLSEATEWYRRDACGSVAAKVCVLPPPPPLPVFPPLFPSLSVSVVSAQEDQEKIKNILY